VPEQQDLQQHDNIADLSSMAKGLAACDAPAELSKAMKKKKKLSACRGEGSVVGLQLRVRFVPAALLATGYAKDCTGSPVCFES
jgi:hypothetical protein